jgi:lipoprotein
MMKTKKIIGLLAVIFSASALFSACDDHSKDPDAYPSILSFPAQGGEQKVIVRSVDGSELVTKWEIYRIVKGERSEEGIKESDTKCVFDTLSDGRIRVKAESLTLTCAADQKSIVVEMSPNTSSKKFFTSLKHLEEGKVST